MSQEQSATPLPPPTFSGLEPGIIPWTLLGFILLSVILHALGFYLFQTIYPPAAHVGPPPIQVGLLTPGTPEADAILRWIASEDPARAAEPGKAPIPGLQTLNYLPSYATVRARPVLAASAAPPIPYPSGVSGLNFIRMAGSSATPASALTQPPPQPPTTLDFSGSLKGQAIDPLPSITSLKESDLGDLQPACYLLGVSASGEARYIFLQASSGDKTLDAAASRLLEQVHFHGNAGADFTWGFATFHWGSAAYAHPAVAEAAP